MQKNRLQFKQPAEYQQKLIDLRRVARVVAGGRRFNFRATLVIGNQKGDVGVGTGKGADTSLAIEKAFRVARKNLIHIPITKNKSIPHFVFSKYGSGRVLIKPAREGNGLVAGGAARTVLSFAGIENASAKILSRTKNKINNARAIINALGQLREKQEK